MSGGVWQGGYFPGKVKCGTMASGDSGKFGSVGSLQHALYNHPLASAASEYKVCFASSVSRVSRDSVPCVEPSGGWP